MKTVRLTSIGNSTGVVLPREILARLRVDKGDALNEGRPDVQGGQTIDAGLRDTGFTGATQVPDGRVRPCLMSAR